MFKVQLWNTWVAGLQNVPYNKFQPAETCFMLSIITMMQCSSGCYAQ